MLVLMGVLFAFAAATSKRRDRLPLVTVALALPVIFAWWEAPTGEYAGLFYVILAAFALVPLIVGSLAGFLLRSVDGTRRAIFIGTVALVLCGWSCGGSTCPRAARAFRSRLAERFWRYLPLSAPGLSGPALSGTSGGTTGSGILRSFAGRAGMEPSQW